MPIKKQVTIESGAFASYHVVRSVKQDMMQRIATVHLVSYFDEASFLAGKPLIANWDEIIPMESIGQNVEVVLTSSGVFAGGEITSDQTDSIWSVKDRKYAEISRASLAADNGTFTHLGKAVDRDEASVRKITAYNGEIALTKAMPDDWPGTWRVADNSFIPIPDTTAWVLFYKAMVAQGSANYKKAQKLKSKVDAAATKDEVDQIHW